MLCQSCSAYNEDDREFCFRCQNKLLVLSGVNAFEEDEVEEYEEEGDLSLDEHLLERVSALEEIVKRTAETLRKWVRQAEVDAGARPGVTTEESAEIKRLKRENAELRRANEILKAAEK